MNIFKISLLPNIPSPHISCTKIKGFVLVFGGGTTYTWQEARDYCVALGTDLYSVNSALKQSNVEATAAALPSPVTTKTWAGLQYSGAAWEWVDGMATDGYFNWRHSPPNTARPKVVLRLDKGGGSYAKWDPTTHSVNGVGAFLCSGEPTPAEGKTKQRVHKKTRECFLPFFELSLHIFCDTDTKHGKHKKRTSPVCQLVFAVCSSLTLKQGLRRTSTIKRERRLSLPNLRVLLCAFTSPPTAHTDADDCASPDAFISMNTSLAWMLKSMLTDLDTIQTDLDLCQHPTS